jgi:hypothetical protein
MLQMRHVYRVDLTHSFLIIIKPIFVTLRDEPLILFRLAKPSQLLEIILRQQMVRQWEIRLEFLVFL